MERGVVSDLGPVAKGDVARTRACSVTEAGLPTDDDVRSNGGVGANYGTTPYNTVVTDLGIRADGASGVHLRSVAKLDVCRHRGALVDVGFAEDL